jgi:hypothetical protein
MKRLESTAFATAVALFIAAALHPGSAAIAQITAACPGGSTLLCGTETVTTCTQIDQRTGQCSRWREQTLYYDYPQADGSGPPDSNCGGLVCQY